MANVKNGNTRFIDTVGEVSNKSTSVQYVLLTATGANAVLVLSDGTDEKKADLRLATSGETKLFDFREFPMHFPTGVKVTTLTNAVATLVV